MTEKQEIIQLYITGASVITSPIVAWVICWASIRNSRDLERRKTLQKIVTTSFLLSSCMSFRHEGETEIVDELTRSASDVERYAELQTLGASLDPNYKLEKKVFEKILGFNGKHGPKTLEDKVRYLDEVTEAARLALQPRHRIFHTDNPSDPYCLEPTEQAARKRVPNG